MSERFLDLHMHSGSKFAHVICHELQPASWREGPDTIILHAKLFYFLQGTLWKLEVHLPDVRGELIMRLATR